MRTAAGRCKNRGTGTPMTQRYVTLFDKEWRELARVPFERCFSQLPRVGESVQLQTAWARWRVLDVEHLAGGSEFSLRLDVDLLAEDRAELLERLK